MILEWRPKRKVKRCKLRAFASGMRDMDSPNRLIIVWTALDDKTAGLWRDDVDVDYPQPEVQ